MDYHLPRLQQGPLSYSDMPKTEPLATTERDTMPRHDYKMRHFVHFGSPKSAPRVTDVRVPCFSVLLVLPLLPLSCPNSHHPSMLFLMYSAFGQVRQAHFGCIPHFVGIVTCISPRLVSPKSGPILPIVRILLLPVVLCWTVSDNGAGL